MSDTAPVNNEKSEPEWDLFLSYASEDKPWCLEFAERLRNEGIRVWFDEWRLKPGDHLHLKINQAIETSRKMVAVWSRHYFTKEWTRAEAFGRHHGDILSQDRPVIPVLIEDRNNLKIPPTLQPLLAIDFTNKDDFEIRFRQLIESLDLPDRKSSERDELFERDVEHELASERGRQAHKKGKRFEDEVATLYRLLGFDVVTDTIVSGMQIDLQIKNRVGGLTTQAIVECKNTRVTSKERDQLIAQQAVTARVLPKYRWIAVSSIGFAADTRNALETVGFDCVTFPELLRDLVPLDTYVEHLIRDYQEWVDDEKNWNGRDLFIRPDIETDVTRDKRKALAHFSRWLGDVRSNLLVVLGDLGTGKSTLSRFLAYQLACSFRDDPLRHPAPILIPLGEVRKEVSLDSIVVKHFRDRGISGLNFSRLEHLIRQGKVIVFFDAFDEMADRVRWEITQSNFQELRRAAEGGGKVVLTCRTHYFKDRTEQSKLIGQGPSLTAAETALYKELRQQSNAEVVYLQEFNEQQIRAYLHDTRGANADADWHKIESIYNLRDLASRPLLLDLIVKTLPSLHENQEINASSLYTVYTNYWVERDYRKGRVVLDKQTKLALMTELAWTLWRDEKMSITARELSAFVARLQGNPSLEFAEEEVEDIAREVQAASFLRRDRDGIDFHFMHRSFGEFFLARKLLDSLATRGPAGTFVLKTRPLDRKVIYFLTLLDEIDQLCPLLQSILTAAYTPAVSENALQILYWSGRVRCEMPDDIPANKPEEFTRLRATLSERIPLGIRMADADLQEVVLEAATFVDADFRRANLTKANLNRTQISESSFFQATLTDTKAEETDFVRVDFRGSNGQKNIWATSRFTDCMGLQGAVTSLSEAIPLSGTVRIGGRLMAGQLWEPVVQLGSAMSVRSVAWSADGNLQAVGGDDGVIRLYSAENGRLIRTIEGHQSTVRSIAFDPHGGKIASGSSDNTIKLWEAETGTLVCTLEGHQNHVWSVAIAPQGQMIASGSSDDMVKLWDAETGRLIRTIEGHENSVWSVAFDPLGRTIASGSDDSTVKLWEAETGTLIRTFEGHEGSVFGVAFDPHGRTIASGSDDNTVKLWEAQTGTLIRTLEGHQNYVFSVAFDPHGGTIASGSSDNTVKLWEAETGTLIRTIAGHLNYVWSVAFDPQGRTIASGSNDNTVKLWEAETGTLIRTLHGHQYSVLSMAFDLRGRLIASGSNDNTIGLWEAQTGTRVRTLQGHHGSVLSVAFDPQGRTIASGSNDNTIKLWEAETGTLIRTLEGHQNSVRSVAFDPHGRTIASGSNDNTIKLWEAETGTLIRKLQGHQNSVRSVAFDPQGRTIASGSNDNTIKLWDAETDTLIRTLPGHNDWILSVAFAPHGQLIASGSYDYTAKLWEAETGTLIRTLEGHIGGLHSVHFARNGRYLVAAGVAGRLQFWDLETYETFLYLYSFGPGAWLALLPDGRFHGSQDALRHLCYTERGTFRSFTAEECLAEFHDPQAVQDVLARYQVPNVTT